jgi:hypothetical protein
MSLETRPREIRISFRFILATLLVAALLVLPAKSSTELPSYVVGPIGPGFMVPNEEVVVFISPGGHIETAYRAAPMLKDKICVVKLAASAAFQILLPACKERYYTKEALLGFHSAHVMFPDGMGLMSPWMLNQIADNLQQTNDQMIGTMLMSFFPMSYSGIRASMKDELALFGEAIMVLHPWIKPVSECTSCPDYIKMIR